MSGWLQPRQQLRNAAVAAVACGLLALSQSTNVNSFFQGRRTWGYAVALMLPTWLLNTKQLDIRAARTFRFGRRRLQAFVEIFNLPNVSTVLTVNTTYGSRWRSPLLIEQPRRFQVSGQFDF